MLIKSFHMQILWSKYLDDIATHLFTPILKIRKLLYLGEQIEMIFQTSEFSGPNHSNSNGCHLNIELFPICQFGNIPACLQPSFPSTLNMTIACRSKDKKLFLYHHSPSVSSSPSSHPQKALFR